MTFDIQKEIKFPRFRRQVLLEKELPVEKKVENFLFDKSVDFQFHNSDLPEVLCSISYKGTVLFEYAVIYGIKVILYSYDFLYNSWINKNFAMDRGYSQYNRTSTELLLSIKQFFEKYFKMDIVDVYSQHGEIEYWITHQSSRL